MKILGIDEDLCTDCKACVRVCPSQLFSMKDDNKVIYTNPFTTCVRCGHCIAICPTKAILFEDAEEPFEIPNAKKIHDIVTYDDLLKIIRIRRSIRVYKEESIQKDKIEAILEAMRYAPTASNTQGWHYAILTDKKEISYLSKEVSKFFKISLKWLPFRYFVAPFVNRKLRKRIMNPRTKVQLEKSVERLEHGEDIIFFNAPCVIILYSRNYANSLSANDAGIALTHGMFAAQALGLGTCWIGFAQRQLQNKRRLRKHFNIPNGYQVWGVLTLGIPDIRYLRGPPRKPLKVQWFE
ncbi:MAG: nitroreductase family protein [Candidatus Thorarchaeota archaeon]